MQTLTNHHLSKITSVFITSINDKFQNLTALVIEIYMEELSYSEIGLYLLTSANMRCNRTSDTY